MARGNEKGGVERAIRYIRDNFFAARQWTDLDDLNTQADTWCSAVSSDRCCPQDPQITVSEAFEREQSSLFSLPDVAFPTEERCEVRIPKTPYARFDLNDYSVPYTHVHKTLPVLASIDTIRLLDGQSEVANHPRSWDKGQQVETEAHITELIAVKKKAREQRGHNRLRHAVPASVALLEQAALRGNPLRSQITELHRLLDEYSAHELEHCCLEVLEQGVPHSNAVRLALQRHREAAQERPAMAVLFPEDNVLRDISVRTATLDTYKHFNAKPKAPDTSTKSTDNHDITNDDG